MWKISDILVQKIKTRILCSIMFSENRVFYDKIWDNMAHPDRAQMVIWRTSMLWRRSKPILRTIFFFYFPKIVTFMRVTFTKASTAKEFFWGHWIPSADDMLVRRNRRLAVTKQRKCLKSQKLLLAFFVCERIICDIYIIATTVGRNVERRLMVKVKVNLEQATNPRRRVEV
jgi:hypothetical protein